MKKLRENKGYSMVEMIICLAIIMILAGMAVVTISSISNSKASASRETFDAELSALQARTKSQSPDNAIKLVKNGDRYDIYYGTSKDGTDFTPNDASKPDAKLEKVSITYSSDGSAGTEVNEQIIKFRKSDGSVVVGYGVYRFNKAGSGKLVARVTLNKDTGNHYYGE